MKIKVKMTKEVYRKTATCQTFPFGFLNADEKDVEDLAENCAVSYAVRELLPGAKTYTTYIKIIGETIILPELAVMLVKKFDSLTRDERLKLPEFSFEIDVPSEVIEKIGIGEVYRILSESKTLEHVVEEIPVEKLA